MQQTEFWFATILLALGAVFFFAAFWCVNKARD